MADESKDTVSFMRPGYAKKGWAADKIPTSRIANLGMAYTIAKEQGLLPPGLDTTLLAMSILEGRDDYGANSSQRFPINQKNKRLVESLFGSDIPTGNALNPLPSAVYTSRFNEKGIDIPNDNKQKTYYTVNSNGEGAPIIGGQLQDAKLMMLKLAQNASRSPDEMVRKYNGTGKASDIGNKKDYVDLVKEIRSSLEQDPANKQILDLYDMITAPISPDF